MVIMHTIYIAGTKMTKLNTTTIAIVQQWNMAYLIFHQENLLGSYTRCVSRDSRFHRKIKTNDTKGLQ